MSPAQKCPWCEGPVVQKPGGHRRRIYCRDQCRWDAHHDRYDPAYNKARSA